MTKAILRYGLIGGAIVSLFMVGTILMMRNMDHMGTWSMVYGFSTMILAFSSIFFAIRSYRNENGGTITFGKALLIGVGITLIASTMYVLTWTIYVNTAGKGFEAKYAAAAQTKMEADSSAAINKMIAENQPADKVEAKQKAIAQMSAQNAKMMAMYQNNVLFKIGITYTEILPVGLIMSLIMAGVFVFMKQRELQPKV